MSARTYWPTILAVFGLLLTSCSASATHELTSAGIAARPTTTPSQVEAPISPEASTTPPAPTTVPEPLATPSEPNAVDPAPAPAFYSWDLSADLPVTSSTDRLVMVDDATDDIQMFDVAQGESIELVVASNGLYGTVLTGDSQLVWTGNAGSKLTARNWDGHRLGELKVTAGGRLLTAFSLTQGAVALVSQQDPASGWDVDIGNLADGILCSTFVSWPEGPLREVDSHLVNSSGRLFDIDSCQWTDAPTEPSFGAQVFEGSIWSAWDGDVYKWSDVDAEFKSQWTGATTADCEPSVRMVLHEGIWIIDNCARELISLDHVTGDIETSSPLPSNVEVKVNVVPYPGGNGLWLVDYADQIRVREPFFYSFDRGRFERLPNTLYHPDESPSTFWPLLVHTDPEARAPLSGR